MTDTEKRELRGKLSDWLRAHGLPLHKSFRCLNPAHPDKHPSMRYNPANDTVHCFACGATYDVFQLVGLEDGIEDFSEQLRVMQQRYGRSVDACTRAHATAYDAQAGEEDFTAFARSGAANRDETAFAWFAGRGISRAAVERCGLFLHAGRAVLPVWQGERCVSWCSRAIAAGAFPRYRNSPGAMAVWGCDTLERCARDGEAVAVCEGILDALSLEECGLAAVALCGAANTGKFAALLDALSVKLCRVILAADADEAGQRMNESLAALLDAAGVPSVRLVLPQGCKDANEALMRDRAALETAVRRAAETEVIMTRCHNNAGEGESIEESEHRGCSSRTPAQQTAACQPIGTAALSARLSHSSQFAGRTTETSPALAALCDSAAAPTSLAGAAEEFLNYIAESGGQAALSTGLPGLDAMLDGGLYPGLYVVGAPSSLGKTTLVLQLADAAAARGRDVLFFSLEMSRWELLAKSLARQAAQEGRRVTARDILRGGVPRSQVEELLTRYTSGSGVRMYTVHVAKPLTAAQLAETALAHRDSHGQAPLVVVDYLQILAPEDARASDKQNTDRAVLRLKALSRELDAPVIAVSSFNRESYNRGAAMEAFKESGSVEYAADVLLALQLTGLGQKDFDQNRAKLADPRREELLLLKNRTGRPFGRLLLCYRAAADLFEEEPGAGATPGMTAAENGACPTADKPTRSAKGGVKRIGPRR